MARAGLVETMRKLKMAGAREPAVAPSVSGPLTGDETVDAVVAAHPGLRAPLMAYGVCTCCSGSMTLRENAAARGIPLEAVLEDLRQELAKTA